MNKLRSRSLSNPQLGKVVFRKLYKSKNPQSISNIKLEQTAISKPPSKQVIILESIKTPVLQPLVTKKMTETPNSIEKALQKLNFKHHNQENCLCDVCSCGRHLCKLISIKPSFKKRTSYSLDYEYKGDDKSLKNEVLITKQVSPLKGDSLIIKSHYKQDFNSLQTSKIQMSKPSDSLKFEGPIQKLTSYENQFRKFGGTNQYVKPTDRHTISNFPFSNRTSYAAQFKQKNIQRAQSLKNKDSFKLGKLWLGQSVYSTKYSQVKNPQISKLFNPILKKSGEILKSPDFLHRFSTNYKKEFVQKQQVHCPSKVQIQKNQQKTNLRHLLNENADFRGMNPQFKAIATSKHYYV